MCCSRTLRDRGGWGGFRDCDVSYVQDLYWCLRTWNLSFTYEEGSRRLCGSDNNRNMSGTLRGGRSLNRVIVYRTLTVASAIIIKINLECPRPSKFTSTTCLTLLLHPEIFVFFQFRNINTSTRSR